NNFDFFKISEFLEHNKNIKVVFVQKSKGYKDRATMKSENIGELVKLVKSINPDIYIVVDNCYGEFAEEHEPAYYGADMIIGSLIKNPGGGIAECGGYITGTKKAVELASYRLTSPLVGTEVGASLGATRNIYKGLFFAPHIVAQSLKIACLTAYVYDRLNLGYEVSPKYNDERYDIIQTIKFFNENKLINFIRGIQAGSAIDSNAIPEPDDMPGYDNKIIMASGSFTQGSSIEISADAPIKPPYIAYTQGGLTYESGKLCIMRALENEDI
ncbi:MAG: methionine gamma-lyase family protein, partial [Oscillospiraceae bacterium]|nr:methionine gamma-lyase family protein [Oscillospiraceae bacterium]